MSTIQESPSASLTSALGLGLSRVTSTPPLPSSSSLFAAHPSELEDFSKSSFRSRSRSPGRNSVWKSSPDSSPTPPNGAPSTWWNGGEIIPRPWRDSPKKKKTVPEEQTEGFVRTRQVSSAHSCALSAHGVSLPLSFPSGIRDLSDLSLSVSSHCCASLLYSSHLLDHSSGIRWGFQPRVILGCAMFPLFFLGFPVLAHAWCNNSVSATSPFPPP